MSPLRRCLMVVLSPQRFELVKAWSKRLSLRKFCTSSLEPSRQTKRNRQDQTLDPVTMGSAKEKMGGRQRSFRGCQRQLREQAKITKLSSHRQKDFYTAACRERVS